MMTTRSVNGRLADLEKRTGKGGPVRVVMLDTWRRPEAECLAELAEAERLSALDGGIIIQIVYGTWTPEGRERMRA